MFIGTAAKPSGQRPQPGVVRRSSAPFMGYLPSVLDWCGSRFERVRQDTLAYLNRCTEEQIETPIPLPEAWHGYFGAATQIEPEELLRWVARHEYYHLGQLNTYAFLRAATGSTIDAASAA